MCSGGGRAGWRWLDGVNGVRCPDAAGAVEIMIWPAAVKHDGGSEPYHDGGGAPSGLARGVQKSGSPWVAALDDGWRMGRPAALPWQSDVIASPLISTLYT